MNRQVDFRQPYYVMVPAPSLAVSTAAAVEELRADEIWNSAVDYRRQLTVRRARVYWPLREVSCFLKRQNLR